MKEVPPQKSENHFLRQIFEEGIKNAIRLIIGGLILWLSYVLFFEKKGYYLLVESEGLEISSQYLSKEISNCIFEIRQSPGRYSSRYSPKLGNGSPLQPNEAFDFEIYSNLSIKRVLKYFNLIPNTIECTIGVDTSGYYCVLLIDSCGFNIVNKKNFDKNIHDLLIRSSEVIVEHYEPKTLLPYFYINENFSHAEELSQRLVTSESERKKQFSVNDTTLLSEFDILQIHSSTLISRYSKLLLTHENEKNYHYIEGKIRNSLSVLKSKIKNNREQSVFYFTKGNHFLNCKKFNESVIQYDSAFYYVNTSSNNFQLSRARILNNKAYAIYNGSAKNIDLAYKVIEEAIGSIKDLYENMPAKQIDNIRQVWGLCISTKCEILWKKSPKKNIEKVKALLMEVKINDKTFEFDESLIEGYPIYKSIVAQAKKDKVWTASMIKLMKTEKEIAFFKDKM